MLAYILKELLRCYSFITIMKHQLKGGSLPSKLCTILKLMAIHGFYGAAE